jgi:hypothetical protein
VGQTKKEPKERNKMGVCRPERTGVELLVGEWELMDGCAICSDGGAVMAKIIRRFLLQMTSDTAF